MELKFPKEFKFGVATSSYQIEGATNEDGRGESIWDRFSSIPGKVADGDTGAIACDHYHRYPEDIKLIKDLAVDAYRFSFAWPRLFPKGDGVRAQKGFDFYDRLVDGLLENGITPFATLYHWDLPQSLEDKGGWPSREILKPFEDYAYAIGEHFGDRIKHFSPINEPWVVSWLGYGIGIHAPGKKSRKDAIRASHHTVVAHNLASNALHKVVKEVKVGPVLNQYLPILDDFTNPESIKAAKVIDANQNTFWIDGIFKGEYSPEVLKYYGDDLSEAIMPGDLSPAKNEWLGINYYSNIRVGQTIPKSDKTNPFVEMIAGVSIDSSPEGELTDMGWPINPSGIAALTLRWKRELGEKCPPIFITENGAAYPDEPGADGAVHDSKRIKYLEKHLAALSSAIELGAPVAGYFQWSLMDNFEWAEGYRKRFGIVHVDYQTQKRTIKDSGIWYRELIKHHQKNTK
jgi:beta-glucosidase